MTARREMLLWSSRFTLTKRELTKGIENLFCEHKAFNPCSVILSIVKLHDRYHELFWSYRNLEYGSWRLYNYHIYIIVSNARHG